MKLKSSTLQLSLIGCLSFLHLTSHAGQLSPSPNNLSSSAVAASSAKNILRPPVQKDSISNKLNPSVNFNELYSSVKSGKAATTKIEGGIAAGGGAIILYPDEHTGKIKAKAIEIYQITEGSAKSKFTLDTGPGQTLQEKIDYVLKRLSKASGLHAEMYGTWIQDILTNPDVADDFSNVMLPRVEDMGVVLLPPGGVPVQVFIQQVPGELSLVTNEPSKRYLWSKKLFYSLDLDSQVALLFHEVIYRDYREVNKNKNTSITMNSQNVQYLTAIILSKEIEKYYLNYKNFERYSVGFMDSEDGYYSFYINDVAESTGFFELLRKLNMSGGSIINWANFDEEIESIKDVNKSFKYHIGYYKPMAQIECYRTSCSSIDYFQEYFSNKIYKKIDFDTPKYRDLSIVGLNFTGNFSILDLERMAADENKFINSSVRITRFANNLNSLDLTNLVNQVHGSNIGIKIESLGNAKTEIRIVNHSKASKRHLIISKNDKIRFVVDNFTIEAIGENEYYKNIDMAANSNADSSDNRITGVKIFNPYGQLILDGLYGIVDFQVTNSYIDPAKRFKFTIAKVIEQGWFKRDKYIKEEVSLREIIEANTK